MNKNVNYGNWVPEKMLALCYVAAAVLGIAACVTGPVLHLAIPTWILGILAAICLIYGIYMHICHELFAFGKGNMMAKVHQHLVDHLEWDGEGTLLDMAVERDIIHKSGAWFSYNGDRLGQGRDKVKQLLKENQALCDEIEQKVRAHAAELLEKSRMKPVSSAPQAAAPVIPAAPVNMEVDLDIDADESDF